MGPPKAKPPRLTYKEQLNRYDTFEQRINTSTGQEYLVNPYTGETCFGTGTGLVDRTVSMWAPFDGRTRAGVVTVHMYPCYYQSRRWGRRPFHGWDGDEQRAATHIAAVTRGWLERKALRAYFRERYDKRICQFSGYYYFYDKWNMDINVETSWYKPILAFPEDILPYMPKDKEDYMDGDKYTYRGFENGPYLTRTGIQKHKVNRATDRTAFIKPDPLRKIAVSSITEVDLDKTPLGTLVAWMDGRKSGMLRIDDYTNIRAAVAGGKWSLVHHYRKKYEHRPLTQCYALFAFSKMEMEVEADGGMSMDCAEAFSHAKALVDDPRSQVPWTVKVFALLVFERFLSTLQGRAEFFDTRPVKTTGKKRQRAIEEYLQGQMRILTRCIDGIEMDSQTFKSKVGAEEEWEETVHFPTYRGADVAALGLSCISLLGQEQEHRELMSETVTVSIIKCMMKCVDEPLVQCHGLRALYNMVYRCNAAQVSILLAPYKPLLKMLDSTWSGDVEVSKLMRRLELALKPNGWRGGVEKIMEKEFKEELACREANLAMSGQLKNTDKDHEGKGEAKGAHGAREHHEQGEATPVTSEIKDGKGHGKHAHESKEHK